MRVSPFASAAWRRVLLVIGDARQRDVLGRAVREMGFEVRTAASPEIALRVLQEHPQDILVADYLLPGVGGPAFLNSVQTAWPEVPGVVLVDFADSHHARKSIRGEVFDFLAKPHALGELERALDRARQRRVQLLPPAPPIPAPPPIGHGADVDEIADEENHDHATLEEIERRHILSTLEKNGGNRTRTAAELGISLRKLYYRLGQYHREGLLPR